MLNLDSIFRDSILILYLYRDGNENISHDLFPRSSLQYRWPVYKYLPIIPSRNARPLLWNPGTGDRDDPPVPGVPSELYLHFPKVIIGIAFEQSIACVSAMSSGRLWFPPSSDRLLRHVYLLLVNTLLRYLTSAPHLVLSISPIAIPKRVPFSTILSTYAI